VGARGHARRRRAGAREAAGRRRGGQAARAPAPRGRPGGEWGRVSWLTALARAWSAGDTTKCGRTWGTLGAHLGHAVRVKAVREGD